MKIGERVLLHPFDLQVLRGERLVIAGPNGAGKSTLMQVLDGKRKPSGGMVWLGAGAKASIFEQQQMRRGGPVRACHLRKEAASLNWKCAIIWPGSGSGEKKYSRAAVLCPRR